MVEVGVAQEEAVKLLNPEYIAGILESVLLELDAGIQKKRVRSCLQLYAAPPHLFCSAMKDKLHAREILD